jgi:hypothetical protein
MHTRTHVFRGKGGGAVDYTDESSDMWSSGSYQFRRDAIRNRSASSTAATAATELRSVPDARWPCLRARVSAPAMD